MIVSFFLRERERICVFVQIYLMNCVTNEGEKEKEKRTFGGRVKDSKMLIRYQIRRNEKKGKLWLEE